MKLLNALQSVAMFLFADTTVPAWVDTLTGAMNWILYPLLILVGTAGTIYAVVIGVTMAKADSTEKREEAKKRLINVIVGIAITAGLILFFVLFVNVILPWLMAEKDTITPTES